VRGIAGAACSVLWVVFLQYRCACVKVSHLGLVAVMHLGAVSLVCCCSSKQSVCGCQLYAGLLLAGLSNGFFVLGAAALVL